MVLSSKHLANSQAMLKLLLHIVIFVRIATKGTATQHTAGVGEDEEPPLLMTNRKNIFSETRAIKNHDGNDAVIGMHSDSTTQNHNATDLSDHDVNLLQNNKKCLFEKQQHTILLLELDLTNQETRNLQ